MFERGLKNSFIENEVTLKILQQTGDQEKLYLLHKSLKPLFHSKIHRSFFGFFLMSCHQTPFAMKIQKKNEKEEEPKTEESNFFSFDVFVHSLNCSTDAA